MTTATLDDVFEALVLLRKTISAGLGVEAAGRNPLEAIAMCLGQHEHGIGTTAVDAIGANTDQQSRIADALERIADVLENQ